MAGLCSTRGVGLRRIDSEALNGAEYDRERRVLTIEFESDSVYEYFDGWGGDISGCRSFDDLPKNAQVYVKALEELSGAPFWAVGVGPGREQTVVVHDR